MKTSTRFELSQEELKRLNSGILNVYFALTRTGERKSLRFTSDVTGRRFAPSQRFSKSVGA